MKRTLDERDAYGNIIGTQSVSKDKDEEQTAYLSGLFVEEKHRGKGVASRLMLAAENLAKSVGLIKTKLEVDSENPAINLYIKRGYIETSRKKAQNGKVYIVLEKKLDE